MISEFFNSAFVEDVNAASNISSLVISKQSLTVAQQAYALSKKLYDEFEETHNTEDRRYLETKNIQIQQLEVMQQILEELKKLNSKK